MNFGWENLLGEQPLKTPNLLPLDNIDMGLRDVWMDEICLENRSMLGFLYKQFRTLGFSYQRLRCSLFSTAQ
jgi:hypothetical protein